MSNEILKGRVAKYAEKLGFPADGLVCDLLSALEAAEQRVDSATHKAELNRKMVEWFAAECKKHRSETDI